jgi:SAM-dependent methyltransferase
MKGGNCVHSELIEAVNKVIDTDPSKIVISNRRSRSPVVDINTARLSEKSSGSSDVTHVYEKIVITPCIIKGDTVYQAEQFTRTQAFHRNMTHNELSGYITELLSDEFRQLDSFSDTCDMNIKISKKGKVMTGRHAKVPVPLTASASHNRKKKRLIEEGTVVPPLIDMGIFTSDGRIVKSMGDKFRQINRFLEIVDDAIETCGFKSVNIVDFGCGKAYLTFILYYYLTYVKHIDAHMTGLDLKADVIADCSKAAEKYGYEKLHFEVGDISQYTSENQIDMVITLHACDTATDYALYNAVNWGSRVILSVPCCQHELNAQIHTDELSALTKYGIIKERISALATDALRASLLENAGYKTQVLEFVDLSHTPKNLLIRAVKTNVSSKKKEKSLKEVESLMKEFHVEPTLYKLLKG